MSDLSKNIKAIAIGDFQASLGQGLTIWSGFGFGKSATVLNTKRQAIPIRAYTSVNENAFFRVLFLPTFRNPATKFGDLRAFVQNWNKVSG